MDSPTPKTYAVLPPVEESALDPNTSYARILHFIEGAPKVVDFGCGPGNLARLLAQRGCTVVGVDINEVHGGIAREYCSDVLIADLDSASLLGLFPTERFDVAIFCDILEHLRNPARLLAEANRILRPGGYVLASIPNIAHGAVRLSMLRGDFDYQELGLLDDTHLRFFTLKTIEELFERSGFLIDDVDRTNAPIYGPAGTLVPHVSRTDFSEQIASLVELSPESQTLQFIVKAVPAGTSDARNAAARRRIVELERRLGDLESELATARAEALDKADLPSKGHYEETLNRLHVAVTRINELEPEMAALQSEREEYASLLRLAETENSKFAARNAELGSYCEELLGDLAEVVAERDALKAVAASHDAVRLNLEEAHERLSALESDNQAWQRHAEALESEITGIREATRAQAAQLIGRVNALEAGLNEREEALDATRARNAELASYCEELLGDLTELGAKRDALEEALDAARRSAITERALLNACVREERERTRSVELSVAVANERLVEIGEMAAETAQRAADLEAALVRAEQRNEAQSHVLSAVGEQLAQAEQRFALLTEELAASAQAEAAQLATLIDTVQSSHFWKLKRWLGRFRLGRLGQQS